MADPDYTPTHGPMVTVKILGRTLSLPENETMLRGLAARCPDDIASGKFCWNGECENCKIHYFDTEQNKEIPVLACQTLVKENLVITRLSPEIRGIK